MKRDEDDLINQLLDETYEVTSHPGKDLSHPKTGSLSDHFERMASQQEETLGNNHPIGKILFLDSFIRVEVRGENLDIPNSISPFARVISPTSETVFEIKDEAFKAVFQDFVGESLDFFEVNENSEFYPKEKELNFSMNKNKIAA